MIVAPEISHIAHDLLERMVDSMDRHLGIEYLELSRDRVVAQMPVDKRTCQPFGLLHGGASVVLAESLCSIGALLNLDVSKFLAVGIEINANHLRSVRSGLVIGTATPVHKGRSTHVWEARLETKDAAGKAGLVCVSRCTLAIVSREASGKTS